MVHERVIRRDDLVIDEETGEILEWPDGLPEAKRLEWLQEQHEEAATEAKAWKLRRQTFSRLVGEFMSAAGIGKYTGPTLRTTWVAPKPARKVLKATVDDALRFKFINHEQADEIRDRAGDLLTEYPVEVIEVMERNGALTPEQAAALVTEVPRGAFAKTSALPKEEPSLARKRRQAFEEGPDGEA